jgi:F420-dependent oxidoreductase-like protein
MKAGIHVTSFTWPGGVSAIAPTLAGIARAADEGGFDHLSLMDHYFQLDGLGGPQGDMLEGYTALGYLAAVTSRIPLGLLVTGVTYRHPGLLAKIVATLDVLSGGRAELGMGAAWNEREHRGLGVPFPPTAERFERLEEALRICLQMWSEDDGPFEGTHYRLKETRCVPLPISRPHPPITVGGSGERKTLRLVARYADACNLFSRTPEEVAHKLDVLRAHCDEAGRDVATIGTSINHFGPLPSPDAFVAQMRPFAELGVDMVILMPIGPDPVGFVERSGAEIVPRLAEL